jgi:4-hydroxybenzoate polyprenyltransferase
MKLAGAFLRLIRWPNLIFIALTQFLFYYCIVRPGFPPSEENARLNLLQPVDFYLLCISSVLIAAAGYIINDYFDLNIDRANKPDRIIIERIIKRRWAIVWHWLLSGIGVLIGFYLSWRLKNFMIGPANLICVGILWFYSTTFKKKLLLGNILISLLTAWVILVIYFCEFRLHRFIDPVYQHYLSTLFKFALLYSAFAFISSLIREVIKDLEDRDGDGKYGRRTMPIVWGVQVSKFFVGTWLAVMVGSLIVLLFYVIQYRRWLTILYALTFVIIPLIQVTRKLYLAQTKDDYRKLSGLVKGVMLAGILSMIFFKLNFPWTQ